MSVECDLRWAYTEAGVLAPCEHENVTSVTIVEVIVDGGEGVGAHQSNCGRDKLTAAVFSKYCGGTVLPHCGRSLARLPAYLCSPV